MATTSSERRAGSDVPSKPDRPLKYVSGDPGPDLVNTIDWTRDGVVSERLTDYQRLTRWAEGAGVLSRAQARSLREVASSRPDAAAEALEVARRLRQVLQRVLASVARGKRDERAWKEFGVYVEDALRHLLVAPRPAGRQDRRAATWTWRDADERLDWFLWPVVRSTAELLTSDEAHRIRVCDGDDCGWVFVDRSRNRLRRWCEMQTCGTVAKSRRRTLMRSVNVACAWAALFAGMPLAAQRSPGPTERPRFVRVTDSPFATMRANTGGVSWVDFDNDGDPDLYVANGFVLENGQPRAQPSWLFENRGGNFVLRDTVLAADSSFSSGSTWADIDNDGDLDVFIPNQRRQGNLLFRNDGNGRFVALDGPVTQSRRMSYSALWADFDGDGLVDLFVSNGGLSGPDRDEMFRNHGGGRFEAVTGSAPTADSSQTAGASASDIDGDGDLDLFVSGRGLASALYRNDGHWRFTRLSDVPMATDPPLVAGSVGHGWGDYDGDGDLDLYMAFVYGERDRIFRNDGNGRFTHVRRTGPGRDPGYTFQPLWIDVDNDGDLDVIVGTWGSPALVYLNDGAGQLERTTLGDLGDIDSFASSIAAADYDGDGDLDVVIGHWPDRPGPEQENLLLRNDGPTGNWLAVDLVGVTSNRSAIGARVEVTAQISGRQVRQVREIASQLVSAARVRSRRISVLGTQRRSIQW